MTIDIIGAEIGGLTTAIALQQKGIATRIYEQAPSLKPCLLYTSPSPRDRTRSRMPSSA